MACGEIVRSTFMWLASRSILGGFATSAGLGLTAMAMPPGTVHDTLASVAQGPATLISGALSSVAGDTTTPAVSAGIFNGFTVLFYSLLWYVLLSVIVQIRGEDDPPPSDRL
jgi:hypothetical protein